MFNYNFCQISRRKIHKQLKHTHSFKVFEGEREGGLFIKSPPRKNPPKIFLLFFPYFFSVFWVCGLLRVFLIDFYGFFVFFVKFACKKYERTENEGRKYD